MNIRKHLENAGVDLLLNTWGCLFLYLNYNRWWVFPYAFYFFSLYFVFVATDLPISGGIFQEQMILMKVNDFSCISYVIDVKYAFPLPFMVTILIDISFFFFFIISFANGKCEVGMKRKKKQIRNHLNFTPDCSIRYSIRGAFTLKFNTENLIKSYRISLLLKTRKNTTWIPKKKRNEE